MSELKCEVVNIEILEHPNADTLELAKVGDYLSVVRKGQFTSGQKVVYIPEQSILPNWLLDELGLGGRLAGKDCNRVKAIKLRDILSQGLVYPAKEEWELGQDVKDLLEITKWTPPVPVDLEGLVGTWGCQLKFDPENIKGYPDVIQEGEEVFYTEKIHGTFCSVTFAPPHLRKSDMLEGKFAVASKRHAHQGIYFLDVPDNINNVYLRAAKLADLPRKLAHFEAQDQPVSLVGEVYGKVQDLKYGVTKDVSFRAFGLKVGNAFLKMQDFLDFCQLYEIPTVPILYHGPHTKESLQKYTDGKEQVSGQETNVREGIVIYLAEEREHPSLGRVMLKSISEHYLLRKGGTEYN